MSEHSQHSEPTPAATGGDPTNPNPVSIDLVVGDPPVPITVWRTARGGDQGSTVSARLAYRLIVAYSRPGEAVVDLTDTTPSPAPAGAGGAGTTRRGSPSPPR